MVILTPKVGDKVWIGCGLVNGCEADNAVTEMLSTKEESLDAIRTEWFSWLSEREKKNSDFHARQYKILSLEADGTVESMISC